MAPSNLDNSQEFSSKQIQLAAQGDQAAISELYESTYNYVYRTVKSMVADEDTVLDIVQDSYVKAFQSLEQLDKPENFRAWIKRIAANKAKDYFKKKKPVLFSEMVTEDDEEIDFEDDRTENLPEEVIDQQETTRLMNEILDSLSEEQRLVIGMFYYEQMSVKEIAEALGCSENTVKSRLNYGRKKVETKVLDLEKQGTKLYSLAPIPFLLWLFYMDSHSAPTAMAIPPAGNILSALEGHSVGASAAGANAGVSAGANAGVSAGAKAAVSAGVKAAGGKVVASKIVAGVLAAAIFGGGTVAAIAVSKRGSSENSIPATGVPTITAPTDVVPATDPSVPAEPTVPPITAEHAYEAVTEDYVKAMTLDKDSFDKTPFLYLNKELSAIWYYRLSPSAFQLYTAEYDINQDGVNELLIGMKTRSQIAVVDVYSFDGEKAVHLVDRPTLGSDSCRLQTMADGTMYFSEAPDGITSTHELMKIAADGHSLEVIDHVYYQAGQDSSQLDALQAKVAKLTPVENFQWNLLTQQNSAAYSDAFNHIISDYKTLINLDHDAFLNDPTIGQRYPLIDEMMYFYHSSPDGFASHKWYHATADIDGDNIPELLIGFGKPGDISLLDCYAWDGKAAAILGVEGNCDILADGTVIDHTGNGGNIAGIYKLENSTLVEAPGITGTYNPADHRAFVAAHGGYFQPNNWTPFA